MAQNAEAREVLGRPKRCKLAHIFLWEHSYQRLKLAQLLGQLGVFLTHRLGRQVPQCPPGAVARTALCATLPRIQRSRAEASVEGQALQTPRAPPTGSDQGSSVGSLGILRGSHRIAQSELGQ